MKERSSKNIRRSRVRKFIQPTHVIAVERLMRVGTQAISLLLMARFLGEQEFGLFATGMAVTGILLPMISQGLEKTLVHLMNFHPEKKGALVGASVILRTTGYLLYALVISGICLFSKGSFSDIEKECILILALGSAGVIGDSAEAPLLVSDNCVLFLCGRIVLYIIGLSMRMLLAVTFRDCRLAAVVVACELSVLGIWSLFCWIRQDREYAGFRDCLRQVRAIWSEGKLYTISFILGTLGGRADQILVRLILGPVSLGVYLISIRVVDIISPVIVAINNKHTWNLATAIKTSWEKYQQEISDISKEYFRISCLVALGAAIFYPLVLHFVVSNHAANLYAAAFAALGIPVIALNSLRSVHLVLNKGGRSQLIFTCVAILTAPLSVLVGSKAGGVFGATIGFVVGQVINTFVISYFVPQTRVLASIQMNSVFHPHWHKLFDSLRKPV